MAEINEEIKITVAEAEPILVTIIDEEQININISEEQPLNITVEHELSAPLNAMFNPLDDGSKIKKLYVENNKLVVVHN